MMQSEQEPIETTIEGEYNFDQFYEEYYKRDSQQKTEYCLQFIISKLNKSCISALVGAGFSLNANLGKSSSEEKYKDWAGLLVNAYKNIHPNSDLLKLPTDNEQFDAIKKEIQKIGESEFSAEYVKKHGSRESLDFYIENEFSKINKKNDELKLHTDLLSLNWCDILTTNWDDLLLRASIKANRKYPLREVLSAKGLKISNRDRIIKLNGSLRTLEQIDGKEYRFDDTDNYLYVITPEDFENYKSEHNGFSNFMKIKTLENSFCLFGFSGHDANFKYWIKELKFTMQKGGQTEEPNPIILIAAPEKEVTYSSDAEKEASELEKKSEEQFLHNNYIIKLKIEDIDEYLKNRFVEYKNIPIGSKYLQKTFIMFENFLKYLLFVTKTPQVQHYDNNENHQDDNNNGHKDDTDIIRQIAFANDKELSDSEIYSYNQTQLFEFQNLNYSSDYVYRIQRLADKVSDWNAETYTFVYKWCLSNYYGLQNLYNSQKIEEIIRQYENNVLSNGESLVFLELVLKYYVDSGNFEVFDETVQNYKNNKRLKDCLTYAQAYYYYVGFHYKKLKNTLSKWKPDKNNPLYSLYILRKISLMLEYENERFISKEEKSKMYEMLESSLESCSDNKQLRYFTLLTYKQIGFGNEDYNRELIEKRIEEIENEVVFPSRYLDELFPSDTDVPIKPNEDTRYTINIQLFTTESPNKDFIKSIRLFNFFDYTGVYSVGILKRSNLIKIQKIVKENEYYLVRLLIKSLEFFGYSRDEDFLRTIVPLILRYLNSNLVSALLKQIYDIFVYKIKNIQNANVYIHLLVETCKRSNERQRSLFIKKFFELLINDIKSNARLSQVAPSILNGSVCGWKIPFEYLLGEFNKYIKDENEVAVLIKWLIDNYVSEEDGLSDKNVNSDAKLYFEAFAINENNAEILKKIFNLKTIKECFASGTDLINYAALYVFSYLDEELQNKIRDYYKDNFTLRIQPYFITVLNDEKINRKVVTLLEEYKILSVNPIQKSFCSYVSAMCYTKLLTDEDTKNISAIIEKKYKELMQSNNSNQYSASTIKQKVTDLFAAICEIRMLIKKEDAFIDNIYKSLKNDFITKNEEFFHFAWLYDENLQNFKANFNNAITIFSYLQEEVKYSYVLNLALSKILVQNSSEFEAVLQQFINCYEKDYGKKVLENETTKQILKQLYNKFSKEIPDCYDDLFIKEQLKRIERILI